MAIKPVTVSQLNEYIARVIGTEPLLGAIVVKGEISAIKYHGTGHIYFSMIDSFSKINCFLPKEYAQKLKVELNDGMEVTVIGSVNVFKKNGTYSINIKNIEISGEGNLSIAFEKLKKKLIGEGLFDENHKKPIPRFPSKIGIITSPTGAAVQDIFKILKTRNNIVDIILFPVLVQGEQSPRDIAKTIDFVNENFDDIDVLIVGRGGGSPESLQAFNEEIVARSIYNAHIPIISAVGHETDFTIADFVSDVRAETPTAAAQMAVPDIGELKENLKELKGSLYLHFSNKIMYNRLLTDNLKSDMKGELISKIRELRNTIEQCKLMLEENNPKKIMESGYAVITTDKGKIVTCIKQLKVDNQYKLSLKDGYANCIITETGSDKDEQGKF